MKKKNNNSSELKSALNSPKLYIEYHLDEKRNQIHLECQTYLAKDDVSLEEKEKAKQQEKAMIKEVNLLQERCLSNLGTFQSDQSGARELDSHLSDLYLNESEAILKIEKEQDALYLRQKLLFMNQGFIFLSKSFLKGFSSKEYSEILFGALLIVRDEYLSNNTVKILKESG